MKKIFKKFKNWLKKEFRILKTYKKNKKVSILDNNTSYVDWIESIERQISQTKIDLALGWIDSSMYEKEMSNYRTKIKDISMSYLEYLKRNNIPISKELRAQFC